MKKNVRLVRERGLEPLHLSTQASETCVSTNSTTRANDVCSQQLSKFVAVFQAELHTLTNNRNKKTLSGGRRGNSNLSEDPNFDIVQSDFQPVSRARWF